jgi:hypothetical protein
MDLAEAADDDIAIADDLAGGVDGVGAAEVVRRILDPGLEHAQILEGSAIAAEDDGAGLAILNGGVADDLAGWADSVNRRIIVVGGAAEIDELVGGLEGGGGGENAGDPEDGGEHAR